MEDSEDENDRILLWQNEYYQIEDEKKNELQEIFSYLKTEMIEIQQSPNDHALFVTPDLIAFLIIGHPNYSLKKLFKSFIIKRNLNNIIWDYDLRIGSYEKHVILFWVSRHLNQILQRLNSFKFKFLMVNALSFLQPTYLKYLTVPFHNPDAITQVNLILDYHSQQKRHFGIDLFNIFDLVAFKMGIDDNRLEYENCEFHKVIDRQLDHLAKHEICLKNKIFDLDEYSKYNALFSIIDDQIIDYFVYHFQHYIDDVHYTKTNRIGIISLSSFKAIPNILLFINNGYDLQVDQIDQNGKWCKILYQLLTSNKSFFKMTFNVDCPFKCQPDILYNFDKKIFGALITINTKNTFGFIEDFISWINQSFGEQSKYIALTLNGSDSIDPDVLMGLHLRRIEFRNVLIIPRLVTIICQWPLSEVAFIDCRIVNDLEQRIEYLQHVTHNEQNIIKLLDQLPNMRLIELRDDEHVIGTVWKYVSCHMARKHLKQFKFKNDIRLGSLRLKDLQFQFNRKSATIQMSSNNDKVYEYFYGANNDNDRNEFNFYQ